MKSKQILVCPSRNTQAWGYGINYNHGYGWSLGTIQYPSEHFLFVENQNQLASCSNPHGFGATYTPHLATLHNDGVNITFCDGHAKWMKPDGEFDGTYTGFLPWHYWPNGDASHMKP
ncbi:MAG: H-X9-DG-CTERM domain-containing protein [Armatimonadia bacterium]